MDNLTPRKGSAGLASSTFKSTASPSSGIQSLCQRMLGMSPAFSPASSQLFPSQNKDNGTGEEDGDRNGPHVALAKHETKDPLLYKEKKFLFGSSNTPSLSFQSVASSSQTDDPFRKKASSSPCRFPCADTGPFTSSGSANREKLVQFQSGKGNVVTTPVKSVPIHSTTSESVGQPTFSPLKPRDDDVFSFTQKKESFKPFQGAGKQLFAETSEDVEGQNDDKLHFEPIFQMKFKL